MKGVGLRRRAFRVELKAWPMIEVWFYRMDRRNLTWRSKVMFNVKDVKTGEPDYFGTDDTVVFFSKCITRQKIAEFAKAAILAQMGHEIEECLEIDGKRAFPDPHRKKRR